MEIQFYDSIIEQFLWAPLDPKIWEGGAETGRVRFLNYNNQTNPLYTLSQNKWRLENLQKNKLFKELISDYTFLLAILITHYNFEYLNIILF